MQDLGALFSFSSENIAVYVLALIVSLSIVIFIHEMGHYLAARCFGVRIEKFSLGFGREIWGFTGPHKTRWSLSSVPLGGYVKLFGDSDPHKPEIWDEGLRQMRPMRDDERCVAFCLKPAWQRFLIVAAGPAINIVFALFILTLLFCVKGEVSSRPIVTGLGMNSSAYEAGFQIGDEIIKVDERDVRRFEDVWDLSYKKVGVPLKFLVRRDGHLLSIEASPRPFAFTAKSGLKESHGRLGATFFQSLKFKDLLSVAGQDTQNNPDRARQLILENLGREIQVAMDIGDFRETFLIMPSVSNNRHLEDRSHKDYEKFYVFTDSEPFYFRHDLGMAFWFAGKKIYEVFEKAMKMTVLVLSGGAKQKSLGGVGSMGSYAGKAAQGGLYSFFAFMAILSAQIAFINLLPIPVLDGGYLIFIGYEMITKKPVSQYIQHVALILGLVFLLGIIIIANVNDLLRLLEP